MDGWTRRVGAGLAVLLTCGCGGAVARPAASSRPDLVVYVLVDALRADRLGCYGSSRALTPHLDALAQEGVLFEAVQASSTWTRSSIASMFTSLHAGSHQVLGRTDGLADEQLTLAEVLRAHGLETLAVTTNGNAGREFGFSQGFDAFVYPPMTVEGEFLAEGVTELALQTVAQRVDRLEGQPLFLYLHYIDPHDPYLPRPGAPVTEAPGRFDGTRPSLEAFDGLPQQERLPADEERLRSLYDGEVWYADAWVGRLVEGLRRLGVLDRTLLVFTADHGEELWEHGLRGHGHNLYQSTLQVPLVVRYPDASRPAPRRVAEPISTVDIAPTILGALGLEPPAGWQGRDLRPLAEGRPRAPGLEGIYSELVIEGRRLQALRLGSLKLIRQTRGPGTAPALARYELYDLASDPREATDLAEREPASRARLEALLDRWQGAVEAAAGTAWRVSPDQLSESTLEELKALGYLE